LTIQWQWDDSLFRGSATYYVQGRLPYAPSLADRLADALALDGTGRLLDVGCGPGVLTLPLAHLFTEAIGLDPDPGMLLEGARRADMAGITNVRWVEARAESLPLGLGTFRIATFGQSFHWLDRLLVAGIIAGMLEPDGFFVHIADLKHPPLPPPPSRIEPPYDAIAALIGHYLGPIRRAGQSLYHGDSPSNEAGILAEAGYCDFQRLVVPNGTVIDRSADDLVAWVFSRSNSAPHLFADRRDEFEQELRALLHTASPNEDFAETVPDTEVFIWRRPRL
jgi:SAM-dependent methyltransferase